MTKNRNPLVELLREAASVEKCPDDTRDVLWSKYTQNVIAHPHLLVDALVDAGVLEHRPIQNGFWFDRVADVYYVPKPHEHDWFVAEIMRLSTEVGVSVRWSCRECGDWAESTAVPPS